MRDALHALREALLDPETFFAERRIGLSPGHAVLVVLAVSLALTAGVGAIGWLLTEQIDATRTVTVAEPRPEAICENFKEMNASENVSFTPEGCAIDEPKTKEVDVGDQLWEAVAGQLPVIFVGGIFAWLLVAGALHGVSALANGSGSFYRTLAVAGWGLLPALFQIGVGVALAFVAIPGAVTSGSPEAVITQARQVLGPGVNPGATLLGLIGTVWQAYVWRGGLVEARNLERSTATGVAAAVAILLLLLGLAG